MCLYPFLHPVCNAQKGKHFTMNCATACVPNVVSHYTLHFKTQVCHNMTHSVLE